MALRPARLLPPKRLSTPRSARRLSATNRGLLPGSPAITRAGLAPAGLVQLSGRTIRTIVVAPDHAATASIARRERSSSRPDRTASSGVARRTVHPGAAIAVPPHPVAPERPPAGMPSEAVGLDGDPWLRVAEIDPGHELTLVVDLVLGNEACDRAGAVGAREVDAAVYDGRALPRSWQVARDLQRPRTEPGDAHDHRRRPMGGHRAVARQKAGAERPLVPGHRRASDPVEPTGRTEPTGR